MFEIEGKLNTALCFASVTDDTAIEQIRRMCDYELASGSQIRIMPDVHAGKGCTIGTTMTITDKACPNIVGVDIGCGMYTVRLADNEIDFKKVDEICHFIPSGMNTWNEKIEEFDLTELKCFPALKKAKRLEKSLGTLGGGNHFIEIDRSENTGEYYLVIHSGSRNLGKQIAELYQKLAIDIHSGQEEYRRKKNELLIRYKAEGKRELIHQALTDLEKQYADRKSEIPEDICWLYGEHLQDYLHDVGVCQRFAKRSRELMATVILEKTGMTGLESFHTIHNYIDTDEMILRKGAIAAHKGEKVLIPINMRDGSILATGRGNAEWNYSAPHGAGRVMSRKKAFETLDIEEYRRSMEGIYTTSVNRMTIDEAPMVYKSFEDIIGDIRDSVDITDILKPVFNFKAPEDDFPWKKKTETEALVCGQSL